MKGTDMEKCTSKGLVSLTYIFLQVSIKKFRKIQIIWIDTLKKDKNSQTFKNVHYAFSQNHNIKKKMS